MRLKTYERAVIRASVLPGFIAIPLVVVPLTALALLGVLRPVWPCLALVCALGLSVLGMVLLAIGTIFEDL